MHRAKRILFVQPFGMNGKAAGGSSKIYRSLISNAPADIGVLVYGVFPPELSRAEDQWFIRERATLGRLEHSRFATWTWRTRTLSWKSSGAKVARSISEWRPDHVHLHLHGVGFIHAARWCRKHKVAFSVSVHDDIRHLVAGDYWAEFIEEEAGKAWAGASNRFVISKEMGEEYSARYGARPWMQITDGLAPDAIAGTPRAGTRNRLIVYFAGAVNWPYEPNIRAMQQALKLYRDEHPGNSVRMVLRGGRHFKWEDASAPEIEVRPFGTPAEVDADMHEVDVLYLPLSIDPLYRNFAKFSLSTKMVTYLGAGLPILYHGPAEAAAAKLLTEAGASAVCTSNNPQEILHALGSCIRQKETIVRNALRLADERFRLEPIREAFWSAILQK